MRRLLAGLAISVMFLGVACSKSPSVDSAAAYTAEFATRARATLPDCRVTVKADLELTVRTASGEERNVFLDNSYQLYRKNPADKEAILAQYIAGLKQTNTMSGPVDRTRITPVVKDKAWPEEAKQAVPKGGKPGGEAFDFIVEPLNEQLVILYAEDSPTTMRYLTQKDIAQLGIDRSTLRALAVENLGRLLPKLESRGGTGIHRLVAGGTYEASLLLFDKIWQSHQLKVKGDYVVAIPTRDVLLVTGTEETEVLATLPAKLQSLSAESPYRLTTDLFVYRDGRFVKFNN